MTKEQIIQIILSAVIGSLSKSVFDSLKKYMPPPKKLISYAWKFLLFNLRYTLATYFLIRAFFDNSPLDKNFVFRISIFCSILLYNFIIDIINNAYQRIISHLDRQSKINVDFLEHHKDIASALKSHQSITKGQTLLFASIIEATGTADKVIDVKKLKEAYGLSDDKK